MNNTGTFKSNFIRHTKHEFLCNNIANIMVNDIVI